MEVQGERRETTVLVADVSNFTAASHRMDQEDVYVLVNEATRTMVEIIYRYEGSIERFTGDGLIALFGAPVSHENDPERAVRAALEIQQALELLRLRALQRYHFDLRVRIGIHTGWVILGRIGDALHTEYTVIGDTLRWASRLESLAEPGTVLVSFTTYQRTRPIFHYQRIVLDANKTHANDSLAFRPLRLREKPGNVRGLPGMQIPLVGREQELDRLWSGFREVVEQGSTRLISVIGEAGLGKSRLVSEFTRKVEDQGMAVYEGVCLAYGRSSPYWMLSDLLRRMADVSENNSGDSQIRAFRHWLQSLPLDYEVDVVLPYLLMALGLETYAPELCRPLSLMEGEMLRQRIQVMLRHILWTVLREPSVLVLEDLHWIDAPSLAFFSHFFATTRELPVLVVLISRDYEPHTQVGELLGLAERHPGYLGAIHLQALTPDQSRAFIERLVPGETPQLQRLKETIVARAEGNPFYMEEMLRMLIDQGALVVQAEGLDVTDEALALVEEIPGTLAGLILARFDRLPPELRRTLQQAAVLGRSFPLRLLQALRPGEAETVHAHLDSLVERHFLQHESFGGEPGYAFRHSLIQDTIYRTLLHRDRQRLEQIVARTTRTGAVARRNGNGFSSQVSSSHHGDRD